MLASGRGLEHTITLSFVALVLTDLTEFLKAYGFRSERRSVLNNPLANRWLNLAIVWGLLLLSLIVRLLFLRGGRPVGLSWPIGALLSRRRLPGAKGA